MDYRQPATGYGYKNLEIKQARFQCRLQKRKMNVETELEAKYGYEMLDAI